MARNFGNSRHVAGISLMLIAVSSGCSSNPPADATARPASATATGQLESNDQEAAALVDSPAFASPEEAIKAWVLAYQQDGVEGHRRLTFDQNDLPDEQWQKTLTERYETAAKTGEVRILDVLKREQLAAVIVLMGDRVDRITLYQDAKGWHVCRSLWTWDAVKMPLEYRGVVKSAFNLNADATVSEIEWRKKLDLE